ncbi:MAG: hypothetical protein WCW04_03500 [Candidatus Paceibacterota bacterium]
MPKIKNKNHENTEIYFSGVDRIFVVDFTRNFSVLPTLRAECIDWELLRSNGNCNSLRSFVYQIHSDNKVCDQNPGTVTKGIFVSIAFDCRVLSNDATAHDPEHSGYA